MWAAPLADALMPIFGKTTPKLAKKGSIDARMKAQVSAREAEAARKAREATAEAMQEAAAAMVVYYLELGYSSTARGPARGHFTAC